MLHNSSITSPHVPSFPIICKHFSIIFQPFTTNFASSSSHLQQNSHHFPIIFPSFPHHFPIIFPSFSHHFPIIFPSFSHHFSKNICKSHMPRPEPMDPESPTRDQRDAAGVPESAECRPSRVKRHHGGFLEGHIYI